jgi:hypothetical protein
MASCRRGRQSNIFPALHDVGGNLITHPADKAQVLKEKFFPATPTSVELNQDSDPRPHPTHTWGPITGEEVSATLKGTSASSALGPSSVGYPILKWVYQATLDALPFLFNLCLNKGTHP